MKNNLLYNLEDVIEDFRKGKFVIIVDDKDRENEGDFVVSAEKINPQKINFLTKYARGLVCVALEKKRAKQLNLEQMVSSQANTSKYGSAFTVSVDAKEGITTGISAFDRARTVKVLIDEKTKPSDLIKPGHIFPLCAEEGGVLKRAGHTEAAVDLAKLANLYPAAVICEILADNGKMARMRELRRIARRYNIKIITIADIIKYRSKHEKLICKVMETELPTKYGRFHLIAYEDTINSNLHIVLIKGRLEELKKRHVLVRVHSECLTGDVFHSKRCDCGEQLEKSFRIISKNGGILLYMPQEGRGIGLRNKLLAYSLQDKGLDTIEANKCLGFKADLRDYGIGAQILKDLGIKKIKLLTNNPRKIVGLKGYGLEIVSRVAIEIRPNRFNKAYLETKRKKLGHLIKRQC